MKFLLFIFILILVSTLTNAKSLSEKGNYLSVSGGIAHPSFNSFIDQNPASYTNNSQKKLILETLIPNGGAGMSYGGHLVLTGSKVAGSAGMRHYSDGGNVGVFGLGLYSSGIDTALGITGKTNLSGGGASFNAGLLIAPKSNVTLGIGAFGIRGGVDAYAAGLNFDFGSAAISCDVGTDKKLNGFRIKPGAIVGNSTAAITLSYGFDSGKPAGGVGNVIQSGMTIGGGFFASQNVLLQIYFNNISNLYAALNILF